MLHPQYYLELYYTNPHIKPNQVYVAQFWCLNDLHIFNFMFVTLRTLDPISATLLQIGMTIMFVCQRKTSKLDANCFSYFCIQVIEHHSCIGMIMNSYLWEIFSSRHLFIAISWTLFCLLLCHVTLTYILHTIFNVRFRTRINNYQFQCTKNICKINNYHFMVMTIQNKGILPDKACGTHSTS